MSARLKWACVLFGGVGIGLGLGGCDEQPDECSVFIETVNRVLSAQGARPKPDPKDVAAVVKERRLLAQSYRELAEAIDRMAIERVDLREPTSRYRKLTQQAASALESSAEALALRKAQQVEHYDAEFRGASEGQREVVARINHLCSRSGR